ncbi:type IV pilus twitching motility protein PilT, partial [Patescibacteria group bacterium]|nr:type IV pilus twitching motility protein PilT [Patescibacteria group bacterium]MBU1630145.1 type IV pilus twitching motility protein PilT [Patescibacteria group bacterium]
KSTLLASMLEHINQNRVEHIVTLEDPIEFVYESKKSLVTQRELGLDFLTFAEGLKHVFRQDPDIVLVGEMRDPESISLALTLAETGHLVLTTLHTNGAAQTVERIIDSFPGAQQQQIRLQLSLMLKGVISQLLLPSLDNRLIPVHEVLINTHAVSNLIREGRTEQLQNTIFTSKDEHMVDLDQELQWLVKEKIISPDVALIHAHNPKNF